MRVGLATSLHLNHAGMSPASRPGDALTMQSFVPMGLLSLQSAAEQAGLDHDIRVLELNTLINRGAIANDGHFYGSLADTILEAGDALVGLMTDADSLHHTLIMADELKRRSPRTLVCLGGPAASPIGRSIIEAFPCVDLVVRGEGEATFVELLKAVESGGRFADIRGLTWRDGEKGIENPERALIDDLDTLPVPFPADFQMDPDAALYLDVGRGCPFNCSFCSTAPFWRRRFRMKSIGRIIREMTLVRDRYGRRHVNFSHDIFTCDRAWTRAFCDALVEADLDITWTCSTRTDLNNKLLADRMAAAGCVEIYYGIESGSQEGQGAINKNLSLATSREVVRATAASGIRPITGFIVGHPNESLGTFGDTLDAFFAFLEIGGFRAHLFPLCPYHESAMFRNTPDTARSQAECFDLPLLAAVDARSQALKRKHPFIFASLYRYGSPEIPPRFIAACEELSPKLVMLKSLWPRLLPLYGSAKDWYARWVDWIEAYNARMRPETRWPHQCDVADLLTFFDEDLDRLGLRDSDLADLVRYERLKLDALSLPVPARACARPRVAPVGSTVILSRPDYVCAPFRHDIKAALSGSERTALADRHWIVCRMSPQGSVQTVELAELAMLILRVAREPVAAGSLFEAVSAATKGPDPATGLSFREYAGLVHQLMQHGLIEEVV